MIRFAIFAAVSTKSQAADDKISLPEQIRLCEQDGISRGWTQTAGPFIVPGHTRTRYINLSAAETNIPPIKAMLDSAQRGEYDLLILYHYNRLRELLEPVAKTLQAYRVQITSHTQWTDPQPPETYDPLSDISNTLRFATGFTSAAEITELRRRFKIGMPARANKGLHKCVIPYGYRKPPGHEYDSKAHAIPDPAATQHIIRIKDLFIAGQSLWQIADDFNAKNIPAPRSAKWTAAKMRHILKNPYYAGTIAYGKTRLVTDPRTGQAKQINSPPESVITAKGLHPPLWDSSTRQRIEEEFKRRGTRSYSGIRTNTLSNLLYCGVCGARCWCNYNGKRENNNRYWTCSKDHSHVKRMDKELIPAFAQELQTRLAKAQSAPIPNPQPPTPNPQLPTLKDIQTRLSRLQDAYEAAAIDLPDYTARRAQLKAQLKDAQQQADQHAADQTHAEQRILTIQTFADILHKIPAYLTQAPPQEVNAHLRKIIAKIIITPASVQIELT